MNTLTNRHNTDFIVNAEMEYIIENLEESTLAICLGSMERGFSFKYRIEDDLMEGAIDRLYDIDGNIFDEVVKALELEITDWTREVIIPRVYDLFNKGYTGNDEQEIVIAEPEADDRRIAINTEIDALMKEADELTKRTIVAQ